MVIRLERLRESTLIMEGNRLVATVKESERHGTFIVKVFTGETKLIVGEDKAITEAKRLARKNVRLFSWNYWQTKKLNNLIFIHKQKGVLKCIQQNKYL